MSTKEKVIKGVRILGIAAMIFGVVVEGKQIYDLVGQLKDAKDYFAKDGKF